MGEKKIRDEDVVPRAVNDAIEKIESFREIEPSWEAVEALEKEFYKKATEVQESANMLVEFYRDMKSIQERMFYLAPRKETSNFHASPLSPVYSWNHLRNYLCSLGLSEIQKNILSGGGSDFKKDMRDGIMWLKKKQKENVDKGIE